MAIRIGFIMRDTDCPLRDLCPLSLFDRDVRVLDTHGPLTVEGPDAGEPQRTADPGRQLCRRQGLVRFFFSCYGHHRDLHSFPTRRSSDLGYWPRNRNAIPCWSTSSATAWTPHSSPCCS